MNICLSGVIDGGVSAVFTVSIQNHSAVPGIICFQTFISHKSKPSWLDKDLGLSLQVPAAVSLWKKLWICWATAWPTNGSSLVSAAWQGFWMLLCRTARVLTLPTPGTCWTRARNSGSNRWDKLILLKEFIRPVKHYIIFIMLFHSPLQCRSFLGCCKREPTILGCSAPTSSSYCRTSPLILSSLPWLCFWPRDFCASFLLSFLVAYPLSAIGSWSEFWSFSYLKYYIFIL